MKNRWLPGTERYHDVVTRKATAAVGTVAALYGYYWLFNTEPEGTPHFVAFGFAALGTAALASSVCSEVEYRIWERREISDFSRSIEAVAVSTPGEMEPFTQPPDENI